MHLYFKKWKRFLSLVLVLLLVCSSMPMSVFAVSEQDAATYLTENYLNSKVITTGGEGVVKQNNTTYLIKRTTPSNSSITSIRMKKENSDSLYKVGWFIEKDAFITPKDAIDGRANISARPEYADGNHTFNAVLKLYDKATPDAEINNDTAAALATQTFTFILESKEQVFSVNFVVKDKNTKQVIEGANVVVEKNWAEIYPDNGVYVLNNVAYEVRVDAIGYIAYKDPAFIPNRDGDVEILLSPSVKHKISFSVVDLNGNPVDTPSIQIQKGYSNISPNSDGTYTLDEGTEYSYSVTKRNFKNKSGKISPTKDETINVVLEKDITEYTVSFLVKDEEGQEIQDSKISVSYDEYDDWTYETYTINIEPNPDKTYTISSYNGVHDYSVSKDGYKKVTGTVNPKGDNENLLIEIVLKKDVAVDPKDQQAVNAARDAFDKEIGILRPVYGKDISVLTMVQQQMINAQNPDLLQDGVTIALKQSDDESVVGKDGSIHYIATDSLSTYGLNSVNVLCRFVFTKGNAQADSTDHSVSVGWDREHFNKKIKGEADSLDISAILGSNSSKDSIVTDLVLPQCMGSSARKVFSKIEWTSSNPEIISFQAPTIDSIINPGTGVVNAPAEDTEVTLTAKFIANDIVLNSLLENVDDFTPVEKTFKVIVKAKPITKEDLQLILDTYYTDDLIMDSITGTKANLTDVQNDLLLPRYTKIKDSEGNLVFENKEIAVTSNNINAAGISGYRVNIDRFASNLNDVVLTVSFTRRNLTVTRDIPLSVKAVTDEELDKEIALLNDVKKNYFAGINDSKNSDRNQIVENLHPFMEARRDENGNIQWIYENNKMKNDGIIPDSYFEDPWEMEGAGYNRFKSSDSNTIKHDNLLVNRSENSKKVTVSSLLSSEKFGKYAPKHPDNKKLQKLYKQEVKVSLTVKGTKVAINALTDKISEAQKLLDSMVEGNAEGTYIPGSKDILESAIKKANSIKDSSPDDKTAEDMTMELDKAIDNAKDSINPKSVALTVVVNLKQNVPGDRYDVSVKSDVAKAFGYKKPDNMRNEVTVIDALAAVHNTLYPDFAVNPQKYLKMSSSGFISRIFGLDTSALGFYVNDQMPVDDSGIGTMANTSILKNKDVVNIFLFHGEYYEDKYLSFGELEKEITQGDTLTLTVNGGFMMQSPLVPQKGVKVAAINVDNQNDIVEGVTDEDGKVELTFTQEGKYEITVVSCETDELFVAPKLALTVAAKQISPEVPEITPDKPIIADKDNQITESEEDIAPSTGDYGYMYLISLFSILGVAIVSIGKKRGNAK